MFLNRAPMVGKNQYSARVFLFLRSPRRAFATIFILAVVLRMTLLLTVQVKNVEWQGEVERIALQLAQTGEFANAYAVPTGPTAHNPPGLPFVYSLVFRIFGTGFAGFLAKVTFTVLCYGLLYASLPRVAIALGLPWETGLVAGFAGALIPFRRASELHMGWEEPLAALLLAALCVLTLRTRGGDLTLPHALAYGVVWGLTFHFAPALLPVFLAFLLLIAFRYAAGWKGVRFSAAAALAMLLVILPWTLRNRAQLGAWMFMRSNFGLELRVSHNDLAGPTATHNNEIYRFFHPGFEPAIARRLAAQGEAAFHKAQLREALEWMRRNPGRTLTLTLQRAFHFWAGPPVWSVTTAAIFLNTVLGLAGMYLLRRRAPDLAAMFAAIWIAYPLVYYCIQVNPRYRAPIDWSVLLCAAFAASYAWPAIRARRALPQAEPVGAAG